MTLNFLKPKNGREKVWIWNMLESKKADDKKSKEVNVQLHTLIVRERKILLDLMLKEIM